MMFVILSFCRIILIPRKETTGTSGQISSNKITIHVVLGMEDNASYSDRSTNSHKNHVKETKEYNSLQQRHIIKKHSTFNYG